MPLQNRVDPFGRIVSYPERGLLMGNRGGQLHGDDGAIVREHASNSWITCAPDFRGRKRQLMSPGQYTELFFLDEATALAAGHRPCFECRPDAAKRFLVLFRRMVGDRGARAPAIDHQLKRERRAPRFGYGSGKVMVLADPNELPAGTMVGHLDEPYLIGDGEMAAWTPGGYRDPVPLPAGEVAMLTPRTTVRILAAGYRPLLAEERPAGS
jgi:hypothetical protein